MHTFFTECYLRCHDVEFPVCPEFDAALSLRAVTAVRPAVLYGSDMAGGGQALCQFFGGEFRHDGQG